jgi:hypothetical protein
MPATEKSPVPCGSIIGSFHFIKLDYFLEPNVKVIGYVINDDKDKSDDDHATWCY